MDEEEIVPGRGSLWVEDHAGASYLAVLQRLHDVLQPENYFEIGSETGASLALARCPSLAIDPYPKIEGQAAIGIKPSFSFYRMTSDAFFARHDPKVILGGPIEMAFLDGMHLSEYLLRDFINTERHAKRNSVIMLHDCLPVEWPMAERTLKGPPVRERYGRAWTGDVWRTALLLKRRRPDLEITAYSAAPTGLVCITNLAPDSTDLGDSYADCVREMMAETLPQLGIETLFSLLDVEPTTAFDRHETISQRFWL